MCKVLEVSRSGYYKWRRRRPSERAKRHAKLVDRIGYHYRDNDGLYGSPKITQLLHNEGWTITEKTVGRIMREQGLRSRTVKKFRVKTTDSNHTLPVAPNLLDQQFQTHAPNQVWMADITYIPTRQGTMYLASVMDLYTRKIVGWKLKNRMPTDLVLEALDTAYDQQKPKPGLMHHTDQGSQYASHEYRKKLNDYGMICSMSRKGNCYDNACIESFHSIIKRELIYLTRFQTRAEARQKIYWYIEFFYNRKRIHSSLGYTSPDRYESAYWEKLMAS